MPCPTLLSTPLLSFPELVRVRPVGAGLVELVDGVTWSLTDTGRAALAADVKTTDEDAYTTAQSTSNIGAHNSIVVCATH